MAAKDRQHIGHTCRRADMAKSVITIRESRAAVHFRKIGRRGWQQQGGPGIRAWSTTAFTNILI